MSARALLKIPQLPSKERIGRRLFQDPPTSLRRWLRRFVALLVFFGVFARIRQYTAAASYWYDEAYLLLNIFDKGFLELLGPLRDDQAGPPIYLWCLRALYLGAGKSEWVMRMPALIASLLALGLMILAARRMLSHIGWLWAVGLCAVCHHAVDRGAEVKPYSWDFFFTLLVLFTANGCLSASIPRDRLRAYVGLFALALLAPWCSLPSVFVLGGASLSLLCHAVRSGTRFHWAAWAGFNLICLGSVGALHLLVLRHQRTPSLAAYWEPFYGDSSSFRALVAAMLGCVVKTANYGSNGLGIPLTVLAAVGGRMLWRRSPAQSLLLAGPVGLALIANSLHLYPLADRLTFFLVPCIFLLSAEAIGSLAEAGCASQRPRWFAWACAVGLTALLIPGIGPTAQKTMCAPQPGYREAFEYVHRHREAGDIYWVSHPQVFEVYFGNSETCLGSYDPIEDVLKQAEGHRIWLIGAGATLQKLEQRFHESEMAPLETHRLSGYSIDLYGPPTTYGSH